jgi:hypothetical protein
MALGHSLLGSCVGLGLELTKTRHLELAKYLDQVHVVDACCFARGPMRPRRVARWAYNFKPRVPCRLLQRSTAAATEKKKGHQRCAVSM